MNQNFVLLTRRHHALQFSRISSNHLHLNKHYIVRETRKSALVEMVNFKRTYVLSGVFRKRHKRGIVHFEFGILGHCEKDLCAEMSILQMA